MTTIPEHVLVAFRFASALWPNDPAATSEATAIVWARTLSAYSADELCMVFEEQARTHPKMPPLVTTLEDLRIQRRKAQRDETPLLEPPSRALSAGPDAGIRQKWRRELVAFNRDRQGHVSRETLALIDEDVAVVGENEQKALDFIASHPHADYGRAARELVDVWSGAVRKVPA